MGHGRNQEAPQGARERGTPLGKEAGRQGPTPQRTGGGLGRQEPAKDAGEGPDLRGLGAPPVSVSAPFERRK